jgi:hypothetical protein
VVGLLAAVPAASASTRSFAGASADGATAFFETSDPLLPADVDTNVDVYQRSAGVTTFLSGGVIGGSDALFAGASADGATVFFTTDESLAAGDTDSSQDVYQRQAGVTTLVSAGQINGNGAFNTGFEGASADGSRVFFSTDEKLINTDNTDSAEDIYQRSGGVTTLVSSGVVNGNGAFPVTFRDASADGSRVYFHTDEQLVAADTDASQDTYQATGGVTSLVSAGAINGNGASTAAFAGASSDGSRAFFISQEQLTADDTDSVTDIYERSGGTTTKISAGQINGNGPSSVTFRGSSADGTRVFFSSAEQLTSADTDSADDIYQRSAGVTSLITLGTSGQNFRATSTDGSRVFFTTSEALVVGDTDVAIDLYQRQGAFTSLISQGQINGNGAFPVTFEGISSDGTHAFFSTSEKLVGGDTDSVGDVYERFSGTTSRVAGQINGNGTLPASFAASSADGSVVFVESDERLTIDDFNLSVQDVFQRSGGLTTLVSTGDPAPTPSGDATVLATSDDADRVFFITDEQLLAGDTDSSLDIYERSAGTTTRVTAGQINGNGPYDATGGSAFALLVAADGTRVFFETAEPLVAADTDFQFDIYERSGGVTSLVSTGPVGGNGPSDAFIAGTSADAGRVFFTTDEQLTADDTDASPDVYERSAGTTTRVSVGQINGNGNGSLSFVGAADDGGRVFFTTTEQLVSADTDSSKDIYERSGGTTAQVSQGQINGNGAFTPLFRGASDNGARVFFSSSEQLATGDTDGSVDLYERSAGATTRVSVGQVNGNGAFNADIADAEGVAAPRSTAVSADGSRVLFTTAEPLVAADGDSVDDIYERSGGTTTLVSGGQAVSAAAASFSAASDDDTHAFFGSAEQIVGGDTDGQFDLYQRASGITSQISIGPAGGNGAFGAGFTDSSADGASAFFFTNESLVAADTDNAVDIYERSGSATTLVSAGQINGNGAFDAGYADDHQLVAAEPGHAVFETAEQLVTADTDSDRDVYERIGGRTRLLSTAKSAPAAPSLTLLTASPANDNSPEIGGSAEALAAIAIFANGSCSGSPVASGTAAQLASSGITVPAAGDAGNTYSATATDTTNHVSPCSASVTYTEDSTAPETQIDSGPAAGSTTADSTPTFGLSANEGGSSFECRIDGTSFAACSGPGAAHTPGALADGQHTFEVRATDAAGNADASPASRTFTVDATGPDTLIDSGPAPGSTTGDSTPSFGFSATEPGSTFECRVDGEAFAACTSEHTTASLTDGQHTFEVRATDAVGNADASPATRAFTVDTVPDTVPDTKAPETTIDQAPKDKLKVKKTATATYAFSSNEAGSTFLCTIDGKPQASCASPLTLTKLKKGNHSFAVVAVDADGNHDPSPATDTFKVKKKRKRRHHH